MRARRRIGAEHTAWDDPETPGELLAKMLPGEPRALTNPNMPFKVLLKQAVYYPQYVEQNPALEMWELEDPPAYRNLTHELDDGWLHAFLSAMPELDRWQLNLTFAYEALPVYEAYSDNGLMRNLLDESLYYVQGRGELSQGEIMREMEHARGVAKAMLDDQDTTAAEEGAAYALLAAATIFKHPGKSADPSTPVNARWALAYDAGMHNSEERGEVAKSQAEVTEFYTKTRRRQADRVRLAYWAEQHHARRQAMYDEVQRQVALSAKKAIENDKRRLATKADIAKAIKQAKAASAQIKTIMESEEPPQTWPVWVGLGVLATGVVVVLVGPEILAGVGVVEGASLLAATVTETGAGAVALTPELATLEAAGLAAQEGAVIAETLEAQQILAQLARKGVDVSLPELASYLAKVRAELALSRVATAVHESVELVVKAAK
jgi:hypothetical protein